MESKAERLWTLFVFSGNFQEWPQTSLEMYPVR